MFFCALFESHLAGDTQGTILVVDLTAAEFRLSPKNSEIAFILIERRGKMSGMFLKTLSKSVRPTAVRAWCGKTYRTHIAYMKVSRLSSREITFWPLDTYLAEEMREKRLLPVVIQDGEKNQAFLEQKT